MAQWNPYFSGTNHNSLYEEQMQPQIFNPYAVPFQHVGYNEYFVPGNVMPNYNASLPAIRTAQEIEAEQFSRFMQTQITTPNPLQNRVRTLD